MSLGKKDLLGVGSMLICSDGDPPRLEERVKLNSPLIESTIFLLVFYFVCGGGEREAVLGDSTQPFLLQQPSPASQGTTTG